MYSAVLELNICESLGSIPSARVKAIKYKEGHS